MYVPDIQYYRVHVANVSGSAMYLSYTGLGSEPKQVPAPSSTAGLYIHPRSPEGSDERAPAIKVAIPQNCLGTSGAECLTVPSEYHQSESS